MKYSQTTQTLGGHVTIGSPFSAKHQTLTDTYYSS